jgi:subtilisin-like proprotein convertase family protein
MIRKLKLLLLFVIPFLFVALLTHWMSAAALSAGPSCSVPGDYGTIQAAVDDPTCETINLDKGVFAENVSISRTVTIAGQGAGNTMVDGDALGTVFTIQASGVVTLTGLTITNGLGVDGGGVYNNGGDAAIIQSTLSGNSAGDGGAIANFGRMTIDDSAISDNEASFGGAIFNRGTMTITHSTVRDNSAGSGIGGGIANGGAMILNDNTLSNNTSGSGGGIYNDRSGNMTIDNSTISGNSASTGDGGGILNEFGTMILDNSTLSGNSGSVAGGGIANTGPMTLSNSIVANSPSGGDCSGAISSQGHNLDGDDTCNLTATGDITNTNPFLGPLQDNGGDTFTHALLTGSPAIDAGNCPGAGADQRDLSRPVDVLDVANVADTCDIGAFEVQNNLPTATFCRAPNRTIPDDDPAGITDTLNIAEPGVIIDVDVVVTASHEWVGDLVFTLDHNGDSVTIIDRPGTSTPLVGCAGVDIAATLDDDALSPVEDECEPDPAIAGRFQPNESLSAFKGDDLVGDWILTASDNHFNFTGALDEWCLTFIYDVAVEGLTAGNDSPTSLGQATTLTATITAGSNISYTWDFGDGQLGSGVVVTHTYPATGAYTAVVTASNPVNSLITSTVVTIVDEPISGLTANNNSPTEAGRPTILTATITAGSNVSYTWAFDDGATGSGALVAHTYPLTGTYAAVVTATNSVSTYIATTMVTVTEPPFRSYLPLIIRRWLFSS